MKRLMLVEDNPKDMKRGAEIARDSGFQIVDAHASLIPAKTYIDDGLGGFRSLPDVIVLDLNLGLDSGFELLRFWHSTPRLNSIPMIVWSVMGDEQRICNLFKVTKVVAKREGDEVMRAALLDLPVTPDSGYTSRQ
jgi:CheY-like chemotaxis protein